MSKNTVLKYYHKKGLLLFIITVSFCVVAVAQTQWELAKDKNGIKVYTSKDGTSKYKSIKVETVYEGTIQQLMDIMINVGKNDWVYNTKQCYLLKKISPLEILYYNETSVPWPLNNRDIPILMKFFPDEKMNTLHVTSEGLPKMMPEKKGIVRIPYFTSTWDVKSDGKKMLQISYVLSTDPGGSVPAWISNLFIARGPYETFYNLGQLLKEQNKM